MRIYVTSVPVDDQAKAEDFYTRVLGFRVKHDVPVGEDRWLTVVSPENPDGSVIAIDRKMNAAGFRVYKDSQERTTSALSFGLPPLFGNNTLCYDPAAL